MTDTRAAHGSYTTLVILAYAQRDLFNPNKRKIVAASATLPNREHIYAHASQIFDIADRKGVLAGDLLWIP